MNSDGASTQTATRERQLLLIEDDESAVLGYTRYLSKAGYVTHSAPDLSRAKNVLSERFFDAVLLDLNLPDGNALNWIPQFKENHPETPVIVVTGVGDIPTAVRATKYGAENFLTKPVNFDDLKTSLHRCLQVGTLRRHELAYRRLNKKDTPYFGTSRPAAQIMDQARIASASDTVLLIQGETGTGKGVLARWIHENSARSAEAFVELNCSTLRGELLRSELFGHVKGAFTSAVKDREGLIEVADEGTLFLDEIGDMDIEVQAQLLKTIEERTYRRIGDNRQRTSEFRLICATNKDPLTAVREGSLRSDLYYRICVFPIQLPALRDRTEDIPGLAEHILKNFGYNHLPLSSEITDALCNYQWPGNIRELKNAFERALLLAQGTRLEPRHLLGISSHKPAEEKEEALTLDAAERRHIERVLAEVNGDKNKASEILGISLSSLYRRLSK